MGKWEKFADELEEEEALTKAPAFEDAVVDVVNPADVTMPPEIRGCQVIERRHPGGQSEIFYCRPEGLVYSEAQANEFIEAFRAAPAGAAPAGAVPAGVGAPAADMVIDTLGTGKDVPQQLRGARLVDRGGNFLFITVDGAELPKEIGDSLFEAFESPEVTNPGLVIGTAALPQQPAAPVEPQPAPEAPETAIDTLGEGQDVPPTLRGAKLVERDGSFFFITKDQDAIPKEIGDDLFDAWDAPEEREAATGAPEPTPGQDVAPAAEEAPPAEQPAAADAPAPEADEPTAQADAPAAQADAPAPAPEPAPEPEPTPEADEDVLEFLGTGEDVPPKLRGGRLVKRTDGFYYVTTNDEAMPAEIGEDLIAAWNPDLGPQDEAPPPAEPTPGPLMKPFGYDDFGPVTVPNVMLPETIEVDRAAVTAESIIEPGAEAPQAEEPQAEEPKAEEPKAEEPKAEEPKAEEPKAEEPKAEEPQAEEPQAEEPQAEAPQAEAPQAASPSAPVTEKLESGSLEDQLKRAVTAVRREATTGSFDVAEATPTQNQLESLVNQLITDDPDDAMLSRMLRRSTQLSEQITEAWVDDDNRGRQALHRDVASGTLLVVAINPTQLKDLDVLGLLTVLRLRTSDGTDRVVSDLTKTLRTKLADDLSRAIKASYLTDQVLQGARSTAGVVTAGRLWPEGVTSLVAQTISREISLTVGGVLDSYREKGYAFPGLAEKVLEAYRHFATDIGERVANAIE